MADRSDDYLALVRVVSSLLYAYDPDGMGLSAGSPSDEYDAPAARVITELVKVGTATEAADHLRQTYPSAEEGLIEGVVAAVELFRAKRSPTSERPEVPLVGGRRDQARTSDGARDDLISGGRARAYPASFTLGGTDTMKKKHQRPWWLRVDGIPAVAERNLAKGREIRWDRMGPLFVVGGIVGAIAPVVWGPLGVLVMIASVALLGVVTQWTNFLTRSGDQLRDARPPLRQ